MPTFAGIDCRPAVIRQPASAGRPAFCNIARSVCIGSTVAVTSPQTIAEISVVDHHPAVPRQTGWRRPPAYRNAARSVCIGSTMAVTSSQTIAEISVVDVDLHPAVPRQTGWRRPPRLPQRRTQRLHLLDGRRHAAADDHGDLLADASHWPLERGQRGAASQPRRRSGARRGTQRGGHRLGIGHDNRMNLVSRSPFDRRVARPLRAERDVAMLVIAGNSTPCPARASAHSSRRLPFRPRPPHVVPAVARQPFERHTAARRRRPASTIASGFAGAAAISSIIVAACHCARDRRTDARTHHCCRAPTARTHSPRPSSPRARRLRRPRRGSARAARDALSGTTTSTGTPARGRNTRPRCPRCRPTTTPKRRAPAASRFADGADAAQLERADGCSASSFSRMVLPSRRDAIGEQR